MNTTERIARARKGDEEQLKWIAEEFKPGILREIRLRVPPRWRYVAMTAEDLYQETLITFFKRDRKKPFDLKHAGALHAVLCHIARGASHDMLRREMAAKRGGGTMAQAWPKSGVFSSEPQPSQQIEQRDMVEHIQPLFTPKERAIVELWMSGMEWKRIGLMLGCTTEAARMRFQRSVSRVRKLVERQQK